MKLRDTILSAYVALALLSCVRDKDTPKDDGAPPVSTSVTPALTVNPTASASAPIDAAPAVPAWAAAYDDRNDAPATSGDARCPQAAPANAKPAGVKVDLVASPPAIELSIPALGVKQRLWPGSTTPSECRAAIVDDGKALRFHCSEDSSSIDGKLYFRKNDIQLGRATPSGAATSKFVLPCETPPKLEPIGCPATCKKTGEQSCTCGSFTKK